MKIDAPSSKKQTGVRYAGDFECYFCADRFDSKLGKLVFNRTIGLRDSFGK